MSMSEWYAGKCIFITGATGFMGKVLVEKLLRTLPGIKKIYVLIRQKRGTYPEKRLKNLFNLPVFQNLKESNPSVLEKVVAIEGDITVEGLEISEQYTKILQEEVSIVFHGAATLKLEAELKDSVNQNLIGTKNVLNFCLGMKKLEVLLHLSTAFCHCDVEVLEEKIYPPTRNPEDIINLVQWMDDKTLNKITPSILGPHPNTYTFTKRLAETVVYEMGSKLPVTIMRPSIVIPSLKEPFPGWVDSLNGPVGVLAGAGKGVIRSMLVEGKNHAEIIPVDIAVNSMIIIAWYRATKKSTQPSVYNVSQNDIVSITWGEVLEKGRAQLNENPFDWPLWYPDGNIRTNRLEHYIIVLLFQVIPAYFLDFIFLIARQKRFMVRIQNRVRLGMELLQYFTLREWNFKTNKFMQITKSLNEKDYSVFYIDNVEIDINEYLRTTILGTRQFCMKEDLKTLPRARKYMRFLFVLDRFIKFVFVVSVIWYSIYFLKFCYTRLIRI